MLLTQNSSSPFPEAWSSAYADTELTGNVTLSYTFHERDGGGLSHLRTEKLGGTDASSEEVFERVEMGMMTSAVVAGG